MGAEATQDVPDDTDIPYLMALCELAPNMEQLRHEAMDLMGIANIRVSIEIEMVRTSHRGRMYVRQ